MLSLERSKGCSGKRHCMQAPGARPHIKRWAPVFQAPTMWQKPTMTHIQGICLFVLICSANFPSFIFFF